MIFICGGLRTDYIITASGQVRSRLMGGNAVFASLGAHMWRPGEVAVLARVGENYPREWLSQLTDVGVHVEGIRQVPGRQDLRTFYAYLDDNTRVDTEPAVHFARVGAPLPDELADYVHSTPGQDDPDTYGPLAIPPEEFQRVRAAFPDKPVDVLHMSPISIRTQMLLPATARAAGVGLVSADPGERAMRPALMREIEYMLSQVDVFMPSDQEVASLLPGNDGNLLSLARWFADRGPRIVVIKRGSEGAFVYDRSGQSARAWHIPVYAARPVDVTGAGDSFCGAFGAVLWMHGDVVRAAVAATVAASFAIQDYGAMHMAKAEQSEIDRRAALVAAGVRAA